MVGLGLLNGIHMAGTRTLDLKGHCHFRIITPRPHFFPNSIHSLRSSLVLLRITTGGLRSCQFMVPHPALVVLRVSVFDKGNILVMRLKCRTDNFWRGIIFVHQPHPIRCVISWQIRCLRNMLRTNGEGYHQLQGKAGDEVNSVHGQK